MKRQFIQILAGALAMGVTAVSAEAPSLPEAGRDAMHYTGKANTDEIRDGWYDEQALYLVRFDKPALAFRDQGQVLMDESADSQDESADSQDAGSSSPLALQSESTQAYLSELDQTRSDMLGEISDRIGRSVSPTYVYRIANNGFAAEMTPAEAEAIARMPGVATVYRDYELELHTDAGPEWIGAPAIWDGSGVPDATSSLGEGIVFGIIDTGIAVDNPSFAATDPEDGHEHDNPLGEGNYIGLCADGEANEGDCNDKLIGLRAYDSVGGDPVDAQGHGSHVAGTAAGNHVEVEINGQNLIIQGVAPRGNIIAYNACCTSTALTAAMEDVLVDYDELNQSGTVPMVVNYSIGANVQLNPWESGNGRGFLAMREVGIFVASSAGNSGPGEATIGTPAVAPWVATVANSTHDRVIGSTVVSVSGPGSVPAELEDMIAVEAGSGPEVQAFSDVDAVFAGDVESGNEEACSAFSDDTAFTDSVAVVRRGTCNFADKFTNVSDAGAVFALVANNDRELTTMGFEGNPPSIPGVMVSKSDGQGIIDWLDDNGGGTLSLVTGAIIEDPDAADQLAFSSSRGPVLSVPSIIGPDLAAPGTDIIAPVASNGGEAQYAAFSGTSMASPHVAGSAGLLWGVHPDWSAAEVQSALMMTAERDLTDFDDADTNIAGIGAGRVDLNKAAQAGFVLHEDGTAFDAADPSDGGEPGELNLPSFSTSACDDSCSFTRTLTGVRGSAGDPVTYQVTANTPDGVSIEFDKSQISIYDGQDVDLEVSISGLHSAAGRFASIEFEASSGPDLHMPVMLDNTVGEIMGYLQQVAPGRIGEINLIAEDENGQESSADSLVFQGAGSFQFFYFPMPTDVAYPRLEILVDGYQDLILDNSGDGWEPAPGDQFDQGVMELQRLPFEVTSTGVSERKRDSLTSGFEVTTNGWPFQYEATLSMADGSTVQSLGTETVSEIGETESFEFEMADLACGTDYVMTVTLKHMVDDPEDQEHEFDLSTKSCFDGGGDSTFSCSLGNGGHRLDPVIPLLLGLALFGLAARRRG